MLTVEEINKAVEKNWQNQIAWLKKLTSFESQRGNEKECQDWLAENFKDRGWEVDKFNINDVKIDDLPGFSPAVEVNYDNATQVVASIKLPDEKEKKGKSLILCGHIDVVPTGPVEMWKVAQPYSAEVIDNKMYGRGTCDMKSGVSAMVFALDALKTAGYIPASDIFVQTVTEEEATGNGALATLARGYRADACLIPEPTMQEVFRGQIGVIWFRLVVKGKPAHAAENQEGTNAILSTYGLIQALQEFTSQLNERVKKHSWYSKIDKPIKFNPGKIKGGDWTSSTPAWCELDCRLAVLPGLSIEEFRREITDVINESAKKDSFLKESLPEIIWTGFSAIDHIIEPGSDFENTVREAHKAIVGKEPNETLFTGGTDARFYAKYYGIPSFCYGPKGGLMHGFDEYVDLNSLKETTATIAYFIQKWCGLRKI